MNALKGVLLLVVLNFASCTAAPGTDCASSESASPLDFALDVSIVRGTPVEQAGVSGLDAAHRPSKYVLSADGTLRYGLDLSGARGTNWLPPLVRTLSHEQVSRLWSLSQQLGLADAHAANALINPRMIRPARDEIVHVVEFTANDQRWIFIRAASQDQDVNSDTAAIVNALAELAWADESLPAEGTIMPKRYDFGPDPYSRFRTK